MKMDAKHNGASKAEAKYLSGFFQICNYIKMTRLG